MSLVGVSCLSRSVKVDMLLLVLLPSVYCRVCVGRGDGFLLLLVVLLF